jgi:hypothetical protein
MREPRQRHDGASAVAETGGAPPRLPGDQMSSGMGRGRTGVDWMIDVVVWP